jgi:hypothetical protein
VFLLLSSEVLLDAPDFAVQARRIGASRVGLLCVLQRIQGGMKIAHM